MFFRRRTTARAPKIKYPNRTRTPAAQMSVAGLVKKLMRTIFGSRTQPVPHLPAPPAAVIGLCLAYGLFALNMLALSGIVTSLFVPRNFYDLSQFLVDAGALDQLESLSRKERLYGIQAFAFIAVFASTILAQILCETTRRAAIGTFVETHGQWLVRTFWLTPPVAMLALLLGTLTWPYGFAAIACIPLWWLHRLGKGLSALVKGRPILAPTAIV